MSVNPLTKRQAVLRALEVAAHAGSACPSNSALVSWGGRYCDGQGVLMQLVRAGSVRIERRGGNVRRIQVVATGEWTDWSQAGRAMQRVGLEEGGPKLSAEEIIARRVDRDPCRVCGARGDAGCGHGPSTTPVWLPGTAWGRSHGRSGLQVQA